MTTAYVTVFDSTDASFVEIWSPAIIGAMACAFAAALWFKREAMMPNRSERGRLVVAALVIWVSVGWTALALFRIGTAEAAIRKALHEQTMQSVEGYVTSFKPRFGGGSFPERFCVQQQKCFSYFDYLPGPGFHTSGMVEQNMLVHVWYVGNNIVRLDIVPLPKRQPPSGPPPGVGME